MSQDKLIRLVSEGDDKGVGKGHIYYTRKNKRKHAEKKFEFKKFNPVAKKHTVYKDKTETRKHIRKDAFLYVVSSLFS